MIFQGPPGIGKTTIGRIALQMAIDSGTSRFAPDAPFVEVNCSNIQGDERYSLNPIVSSVVDGYYSNVADRNKQNNHPTDMPQINLGATAHAHGGVLFLDEIGELPTWMQNGLLKVLEDKREQIRAARYDATNNKYPEWLHYFFQEGIPADFILIGATTRDPSELTPALRSRCEIIRFRSLDASERATIATNAAIKYGCTISVQAALLIASQTDSGRDAARRVQVAVSRAAARNSTHIEADDVPPGISQLPPRAICARDGCHIISEFKRHVCLRCNIRLRPAKAQPACTCGQPAKYSVAIVSELEATEDVCEKCRSLIGLAGIALPIITSPGGGDTAMGARL
jgi:DNA polymerase III delta prime subunit